MSSVFTRQGSLVQSQPRPPIKAKTYTKYEQGARVQVNKILVAALRAACVPADKSALIAVFLTLVAFLSAAWAQEGPARIVDGDTVVVAGQRVRLAGIDAPEKEQLCGMESLVLKAVPTLIPCGRYAAIGLASLVLDRVVICESQGRDRYGRIVATCATAEGDIGEEMIRQGWAIRYTQYDPECRYCAAEADAKAAKRGMWAGEFQKPEDWRRERR